jgi:hypothetical protein
MTLPDKTFYVGLDVHKKSWAVTIRSLGIELLTLHSLLEQKHF